MADNGEIGVTELSQKFGVSKSNIYNILQTFQVNDWVEKNQETKKYKLGIRLFELGNVVRSRLKLREIAIPFMQDLAEKTGETVHLTVCNDGEVVYVESARSKNKFAIAPVIGRRAPLYCTGVGKAILAFQPPEKIDSIIETSDLKQFTSNTITDEKKLKEEIEYIRVKGYAIDNMEHEYGVKCVAAPIFDGHGNAFASISISGPSIRFSEDVLNDFTKMVMNATKKISRHLGWRKR